MKKTKKWMKEANEYLRELVFIQENLSGYAKKEFQNLVREFNYQEKQQNNLAHQRKNRFSL